MMDDIRIHRVWYHANTEGSERIHYSIELPDGSLRRLYTDRGSELYKVLAAHYAEAPGDVETTGKSGEV